ncbi:uncharacterized protein LOC134536701 [Bacillus rossius redtenbacheri]|uniref:uncharacterized protein LOC134536701 n=1 Tax=Bacillus rossius redtenbacheri TaxID=93214 RepID=UPI002FDED0E7
MEDVMQQQMRSHKRQHEGQHVDTCQDRKRRNSGNKPPELVHYLKDSVLSCSDEDSRPPDLMPEIIVTRRKNNKDKNCKDNSASSLCEEDQEFHGFGSLDIELSEKAYETLQNLPAMEVISSKIEEIHVDNSDILQKLLNLSARVETRKNTSQAEIQKKWFQELQESQKKPVKKTSNCTVKLPRLLSSVCARENMELDRNMNQCLKSGYSFRKEQEESFMSKDKVLNMQCGLSASIQSTPCKLKNSIPSEAVRQIEDEDARSDSSYMYVMPNVSTGKECVDYMDGKLIFAFETEADLEEFTKREDEYRREVSFSPFPFIVPKKTDDITKIKGWRFKKFAIDSDEDSINEEDLEMNDELESLRNEQEALVRRLNNSSDDLEVDGSSVDEHLKNDDMCVPEDDDGSVGSHDASMQKNHVISTQPVNNVIKTKYNVENKKSPEKLISRYSQNSKNTFPKSNYPLKILDPFVTPEKQHSVGELSVKTKESKRKKSSQLNSHRGFDGYKLTANNDGPNTVIADVSSAVAIKHSLSDVTSELRNTELVSSENVSSKACLDPRAPFISHDLDHYLSANPAPVLKFLPEVDNAIAAKEAVFRESEAVAVKQKTVENSSDLHSKRKTDSDMYVSRVAFNTSKVSDSSSHTHYRLAAKALQRCKHSIAVQSRKQARSVDCDRKVLSGNSVPKGDREIGDFDASSNKLKKLTHAKKVWSSRSAIEKKSLVIKKRAFMGEKIRKESINKKAKFSNKKELMKKSLILVKSLPLRFSKTRLLPQKSSKSVAQFAQKSKFVEAVKMVKAKLVEQFASVKQCSIVMHTCVGKPMQDVEVKQLCKIRGDAWEIDWQWANFAASVVTSHPHKAQKCRVQFTVPFESMLLSKLILQQDIDSSLAGNAAVPMSANKQSEIEDPSTREVTRVVEELVNCVVNHEVQDLIILPDPEYDSSKIHLSPTDKTVGGLEKKKSVSIVRELQRLDVNFIEMDTNGEVAENTGDSEDTCGKPFCSLGCVCVSLSAASSISNLTEHCGRVECMFECECGQIQNETISPTRRNGAGDKPSIIPHTTVMRLQDESNRHLAKVEKQFKQTVIKAKDEMIVVSVGGSSRRKREIKMPERYKDSVLGREFLAADFKILSGFEDSVNFLGKDDDGAYLPTKKQKQSVASKNYTLKECSVSVSRLSGALETPLYCMIHEDYGCPCQTSSNKFQQKVESEQNKPNSNDQTHLESRNVAKKSTAMSTVLSHGRIGCKSGDGNVHGWLSNRQENVVGSNIKKTKTLNEENELSMKDNPEPLKIVSVGSMRVEDFESQNIPETFVSSISGSLVVMKANDNMEIEHFQVPSISNIAQLKASDLRRWNEPLRKLETTDYYFSSSIKEEIIKTNYLLNCLSCENFADSGKNLYASPIHVLHHYYTSGKIFIWLYRTDKIPVTRVLVTLSDRKPNRNCAKLKDVKMTYNLKVPQFILNVVKETDESLVNCKSVGAFVCNGSTYELIGAMTSVNETKWYWKRHFDCAMLQCFLLKAGFDPFKKKFLTEPFHPFRWLMIIMKKTFSEAVIGSCLFPYDRLYDLVERCRKEQIDYALHLSDKQRKGFGDECEWRYKFGVYGSAKYCEQVFVGPYDLEEKPDVYLYKKLSNGTVVPLTHNEKLCRWVYTSVNNLKPKSKQADQAERTDTASSPVKSEDGPLGSAVGQFEMVCVEDTSERTPGAGESIQDIIEEMLGDRSRKSEDKSSGRHSQQPEALVLVPSIPSLGFVNCTYHCSSIRLTHFYLEAAPSFSSVLAAGKWLNSYLRTKIKFEPVNLVLEWSINTITVKTNWHPLNLKNLQQGGYVLTEKGLKKVLPRRTPRNRASSRTHCKHTLEYHFKVLRAHLGCSSQKLSRRSVLKLAREEIQVETRKEEMLTKEYSEVIEERQDNVSKIFQLVKDLPPVDRREHLKELDKNLQKQDPVIILDDDDDDDEENEDDSRRSECDSTYSDCSNSDDYLESSDEEEETEDDDDVVMLETLPASTHSRLKPRSDPLSEGGQTNSCSALRVRDVRTLNTAAAAVGGTELVAPVSASAAESPTATSLSAGLSYKLSSVISPNRNRINLSVDENHIHKLEPNAENSQSMLGLTQRLSLFQPSTLNQLSSTPTRVLSVKSGLQSILRPMDGVPVKTPAAKLSVQLPSLLKLAPTRRSKQLATPLSGDESGSDRNPPGGVTSPSSEKEDAGTKSSVALSPLRQSSSRSKETEDVTRNSSLLFSAAGNNDFQGQEKEESPKKGVVSPSAPSLCQSEETEDGTKRPVNVVLPSTQTCHQGSPEKSKVLQLLQASSVGSLQATIQGKTVKFQPVHDVCIVVNSSGQKTLMKTPPLLRKSPARTPTPSPPAPGPS